MPRKRKSQSTPPEPEGYKQLSLFDIINSDSYKVFSRDAVIDYDPVEKTADYMRQIVQSEREWETTIKTAREHLLGIDARQLYLNFFTDLKRQIEQNSSNAPRLARLLEQVAIRGFGMTYEQVRVKSPRQGGMRWEVELNTTSIQEHLQSHIVGEYFLNLINADNSVWGDRTPVLGSSDVSQHRSAVPIPARFFMRSVPFVLNNAAGTLFRMQGGEPKYEALFNPKPDDQLLQWMLIDPSYRDDLEPEHYQRCLASAMDVGQYKFDNQYLLNVDRRPPDIIFRDGSLFPQDAYLDNFLIDNRRGVFTREAIRELDNCLTNAEKSGVIYCGVSKRVQLKVYSAVVDWYITKHLAPEWEVGNYTLNDGQAMTLLLACPEKVKEELRQTISTCLIRRSFTTRANLNVKAKNINDLESYFKAYENNQFNINPFRHLCQTAHFYMFFIGLAKSPQQQFPRYEFFYSNSFGKNEIIVNKIISAICYSSLEIDQDHSYGLEEEISYLIPTVTQQAHYYSKDIGKYISEDTGHRIMSEYKSLLSQII